MSEFAENAMQCNIVNNGFDPYREVIVAKSYNKQTTKRKNPENENRENILL